MPADVHALIGAYVLDALDDRERPRFLAHLDGCPGCRQQLAGLEAASSELDDLGA